MISNRIPLKLSSNRVWRTYKGGRLIEEWLHLSNATDGCFPEEWVASVTQAYNPGREFVADEGLSHIETEDGQRIMLKQLIESDPAAFLGSEHIRKHGGHTAVLIKLLDSAERLTIQVHPDRNIAKTLFQSNFGKTEVWYILGGRIIGGESPYVLLGFKPGITRDIWMELFNNQDIEGMMRSLHKFYIKPGQVFLIEGGNPHAIGPGCFLAEIQEPTDYTLRVERETPSGQEVPDILCHQGIGFDRMFDCFHYDGYNEDEVLRRWNLKPDIMYETAEATEKMLVGPKNTPYFSMVETEVHTAIHIKNSDVFSVVVIISGEGTMYWNGGFRAVSQGQQFFIPANIGEMSFKNAASTRPLRLIRCFPPL